MKKKYIQPEWIIQQFESEATVMAGSFRGQGGDYTGDDDYHGTDPNVKPDTDEDEDIIHLPGADD